MVTMVYTTGNEWDDFGNLIMAIGLVALIAYLAPGMMSISPQWARRLQIVAIASLTVALILAMIATAMWFVR
jgi:flagellar biogenesis protein FliO